MTMARLSPIVLGLALVFTPAVHALADGHFDRTLSVSSGLTLTVNTGSGSIHVTPGNDSQLHIAGQVHATHSWFGVGNGDLDARVRQIESNPPIRQSGHAVIVGETGHSDLFRDIGIDYEIQTPRGTIVHASTGSGDVQIEAPGAGSSFSSGSGAIRVNNLRGGATFRTGSGDIQLQQASGGDVKAETGSGSIRINGFAGGLFAQTGSGDIQVEGRASADWKLETGSGSIRIGIGQGTHANLDASTGSGTVRVSQPITMQGEMEKRRTRGTINGGGPTIRCSTGSGDIEVH